MPISYKRLFDMLEKNGWTTYLEYYLQEISFSSSGKSKRQKDKVPCESLCIAESTERNTPDPKGVKIYSLAISMIIS